MGQYWNGSRGDCKSKDLKANRHLHIQSSSNFNLGLKQNGKRACCGGRIQTSSLRGSPMMAVEQVGETTISPTNSLKEHLNPEQIPQKQLLNAGKGHQAPRKAAHFLQKEVRQNEVGMEICPRRESSKRRSFQTPGNTLTGRSVGSFGISECNITGRKNK